MIGPTRARLAALAAAVAATLTLSACGGDESGDVEQQVEEALESVAESAQDAGDVDIETGGDLPAGFPEDEVPVLDHDYHGGSGVALGDGGKQYTLLFTPDDQAAAYNEAVELLEDAGFKADEVVEVGDGRSLQLTSDAWRVGLADSVGGLSYMVMPRS